MLVVQGANDVIALSELGVPSVGLCANTITREQAAKAAELARDLDGGVVTLMLNCDAEGDNGARQAVAELAQHCAVRLAWSRQMHGGRFADRQPESLSPEEWQLIYDSLCSLGTNA